MKTLTIINQLSGGRTLLPLPGSGRNIFTFLNRLSVALLLIGVTILTTTQHSYGQNFELAPNGVTVLCPDAALNETGDIDGTTYTKRDRDGLDALLATDPNNPELATTCTSGIEDMSSLFAANFFFSIRISAAGIPAM